MGRNMAARFQSSCPQSQGFTSETFGYLRSEPVASQQSSCRILQIGRPPGNVRQVLPKARAILSSAGGLAWLDDLGHDAHPFFQSRVASVDRHENADQVLSFLYETEWKQTVSRVNAAVQYAVLEGWEAAVDRAWDEFPLATGDALPG